MLRATSALVGSAMTLASFGAHAADTIKVGILHSLSGTMAISETTLKDVMLMLIEEQNKKGGLLGKKLPRHDVRMVLELGQKNFISVPNKFAAKRIRHKVDRLGSPSRKNNFFFIFGAEEFPDLFAGFFERGCCPLSQLIGGAVDGRVVMGIEA